MPVVPNNGTFYIELSSEAAVAEFVAVARSLDAAKVAKFGTRDARTAADIEDHLMFLAATNPDWFVPYRDLAATTLSAQMPMSLAIAAVLLPGISAPAVDELCERLEARPSDWATLSLLAATKDRRGLAALADIVRRAGTIEWTNRLGVHVGDEGPALWRFSPVRHAIVVPPDDDTASPDGWVGLPLDQVVDDPSGVITWHYLSLRVEAIEGAPPWPAELIHLVSPRTFWFTLHCAVAGDGRYQNPTVDDEGEPFDAGLRAIEQDPRPPAAARLHRYDETLIYRNGHVYLTPNVGGDAGGPPVGIYPNPVCPECGILMFHVATVLSTIREYGEGFRSVFVCEYCVRAAVTGTNWN